MLSNYFYNFDRSIHSLYDVPTALYHMVHNEMKALSPAGCDPIIGVAAMRLGHAYAYFHLYTKSIACYKSALALWQMAYGKVLHIDILRAYTYLEIAHIKNGQHGKATAIHNKSSVFIKNEIN